MITVVTEKNKEVHVEFSTEEACQSKSNPMSQVFHGNYQESFLIPAEGRTILLMGCGKEKELTLFRVKEIFAFTASQLTKYKIKEASMDVGYFVDRCGKEALTQAVIGLNLGSYSYCYKKSEPKHEQVDGKYELMGIQFFSDKEHFIEEGEELSRSICFARDLSNTPGNHMRPEKLVDSIAEFEEDAGITVTKIKYEELKKLGMEALCGVGESSEFLPYLLILNYKGAPDANETYGLVGKGVTCDTGGYCLKGSQSMAGIKGDMAGAAAVAGAVHAIAREKLPLNVTAILPICENRISPSSHLPGDVITTYSGKTVEIANTDAEGRLILADAISYGIRNLGITKIVDIATLTGAAWSALGYTIAASLSNEDAFYSLFQKGLEHSTETYLRFPYGEEHDKMIESNVADLKNMGSNCCGVITAGLFIRQFVEDKPWIHLDIAGTAWCETPCFSFESKGATGAGVTSLYYLIKEAAGLRL
ncbi:MAG: M17 family peptidase N-terminal domain-containing protein [Lachnospiraceae bacterium]